ncbi:MAG: rhodanese-like domain-containing protein [Slackia sp.]|uniref:rhodanese-like domain-containing protein n=1 Tax=uncultured Slackia sp. TaxID=665903 RepID=UPI002803D87A|nr:rhodanese-like domain-containing protein [uncultured Slackia sp.]MDU6011763.1 rhodanese-like domain-containing protein [Slackia sp.]
MKHMTMVVSALLVAGVMLAGCSQGAGAGVGADAGAGIDAGAGNADAPGFRQATAQEAKELMDSEEDFIIVDVRTAGEYDEGHVPGAVLLPLDTLAEKAESALTDKDQLILVYCRSGNRSRQAAETLASLGYTNVVDFGGISSWPYDIEK